MAARIPNAERSDRTRAALVKVAREFFAEQGYAGTSTQDIVERADVTRGALYYHFKNKEGIFRAVFREEEDRRARAIRTRMLTATGDTWQRLIETGCDAFIDNTSDRGSQRIMYVDGPAVLDKYLWHDRAPVVDLIRQTLEALMDEGLIQETRSEVLARLLWGAFLQAGITIALADDVAQAQREMRQGLRYVFDCLRVTPGA